MYRDHTKVIQIGNKKIGGGNPILIQSMTNTRTEDVEATVSQIRRLTAAGFSYNTEYFTLINSQINIPYGFYFAFGSIKTH